ncbi:MAG: thioredoxin family protein [Xanthobacteraceae bacterium]|nr:thioredoxin family protein [Xanthobacteraceae bacterium]
MIGFRALRSGLLAAGLCFLSISPSLAAATAWIGDKRGSVRLITASDSINGSSLQAGLEFDYPEPWHGYWRTPGDAGIAPVLDWSASRNLKGQVVSWPAPSRLVVSDLQNSVYSGHFILPLDLTLADPHGAAHVALSIDYAACADICVPKHAELVLDLRTGAGGASAESDLLAAARSAIPGTPAAAGIEIVRQHIESDGNERLLVVTLHSTAEAFRRPDLFVEGAGDGLPPEPSAAFSNNGQTVTLTTELPPDFKPSDQTTLTVVDGFRTAEFAGPVPLTARSRATPPPHEGGLLAILLVALLGGLILNLMPCVLPILSIKLFAFAQHAGGEQVQARKGAVATALGILTSFLLLAAVLIGLKQSGAALGWGIQFQQPWFLVAMAAVTTLFAASFFEWLPIQLPQAIAQISGGSARGPQIEAFLSGVFATLLATPCSAPFVGTAVGFALTGGPLEILAVFACLGLGMALPFMAVAIAPRLVTWLPKPGTWMVRLRQVLGLLLLGTAAWLLAVLWSVAGAVVTVTVTVLLASLLVLRAFATHRASDQKWPGIATAGLVAAALVAASLPASGVTGQHDEADGWQAFDPAAIDTLVAQGKTVLVDVTASWCLTCKVNELTAFADSQVKERLAQPGTIRMRADWSRPNPAIAAYIQRFGRFGIPMDVVYGPRNSDGQALPEVLTPTTVLRALDDAGAEKMKSADRRP